MIGLLLQCLGTSREPIAVSHGLVARIAGARQASYRCQIQDFEGNDLSDGTLSNYPRWSEPLSVFTARALAPVLKNAPSARPPSACFRYVLDISLNGQRLSRTPFALLDGSLALSNNRFFELNEPRVGWYLASAALCADQVGSLDLPAVPPILEPQVYEYDGVRYCRSVDLPPEARVAFESAQRGSQCPWIPGVEDAFYVQDMLSFLEGSVRFM